ncbi:hypothetical protein AAOE16_14265 [Ekhidna sp. MALMAid0563]|uniref:hypothetical protein n=1 Tax=Ekhidna sp. MALMAid0563 TaxID=3143937 RepID=UPI0032E04F85
MLSNKAIDMLEYNGYSFKTNGNQILFKKAGTDQMGLIIVMIFTAIVIGIFFAIQWWAGLGALVVAFLIFRPLVKRIPGSLKLAIEPGTRKLELNNRSMAFSFEDIKGIYIHSKFVDEYSSAFKSTSEEHQVTIGLEAQNQIPLFKLISDHAKPSKEMNEVYDYLKSIISPEKASSAA